MAIEQVTRPRLPGPHPEVGGTRRGRRRNLVVMVLALLAALTCASESAAHVALSETDPADGSTVTAAVDTVSLTFTADAAPAGQGVELFDGEGQPISVGAIDGTGTPRWTVRPDVALASGDYGLRWSVAAMDAHAMTGTVRFTVSVPAPADVSTAVAPAPVPAAVDPGDAREDVAQPASIVTGTPVQMSGSLTESLDAPDQRLVQLLGGGGRWLSYVGALVAVGALLVALSTLVGSRGDVVVSEVLVRAAGAVAAVGAVIEVVALVMVFGGSVPRLTLLAACLRVVGGVLMVATARLVAQRTGGRRARTIQALPVPAAVGVGVGGDTSWQSLVPPMRVDAVRVRAVADIPPAVVTASLILLGSFVLDGHTAATQPWPVMAAADLAHTLAAAVWLGGVVLLAVLLVSRARLGIPTGAGELAVRFSVPATAAAATVGVTGSVMAVLIVDTPAELVTTSWGKVLVVKLVVVAVVAALGFFNNRYAVPALDNWRPGTARTLRRTVIVEGLIMLTVLAVTAVLVASPV